MMTTETDHGMTPFPFPPVYDERAALLRALRGWVAQRPGLDPRNYISHGGDETGRRAYRAEVAGIRRNLHDARILLVAVEHARYGIPADALARACASAYGGRLRWTWDGHTGRLDYCTGQYWPTEYRAAVCAVLAAALWAAAREARPDEDGDALRRHFRAVYGRGVAGRWFR